MNVDEKSLKNLENLKPLIETLSKKGIAVIILLLAIIAFGLYALVVQIVDGHIVTGMRDNVVWGLYIVNFIFFIGISYAGALISGILHLLRVPWRTPIIRMAEMITVISTLIGPAYILLCIGRLDRLPNLILFGRIQSPIIWDVIAITTYLSGSIIFLYLAMIRDLALLRDNPVQKARWRNPIYRILAVSYKDTTRQKELLNMVTDLLSIVIIPLAILVHSVLAWIFGMTLRPGWHSTIFAPYFVVAAVYSGTGVLIMVMWVFRRIYHLESQITKIHFNYLGIIMIILGALYGYFTFSEYLTSWYGSIKWDMEVLFRLFNPSQYFGEFIFAAFIGVLLPIIIVTVPKFRSINSIAFASFIAVAALWIKRYLIIIPTLETPLLPAHDLRPEYVNYAPTWVEWALTLAGIAMFILLFFLFSKFIPILPMVRTGEEKDYSRLRKKAEQRREKGADKKTAGAVAIPVALVFLAFSGSLQAQTPDEAGVRTVLKLDYGNVNGARHLTATLKAKQEGRFLPWQEGEIHFFWQGKDEKRELGVAESDSKGRAEIDLPDDLFKPGPETYLFSALFNGKDSLAASASEVSVRDMKFEISCTEQDSLKVITVKASEPGQAGAPVPVNDLEIQFYIPRTFSLLKVGSSTLADGAASFKFPAGLPGDSLGVLTVIAKIEDNEIYGNLEASERVGWGRPVVPEKIVSRGLGDTDAPLWMVYTLIVLLSLVWIHYLVVIGTIVRIRMLGGKTKTQN